MTTETKVCTTCRGTGKCISCSGTGEERSAGDYYHGDVHPGPDWGKRNVKACSGCNGTGT